MSNIRLASFTNKPIKNSALDGKELPRRIKVMNWGKNETLDDPVFLNDSSARVFAKNQKEIGRSKDVPLDFDHCTVPNSENYVKGGVRSIAGYGTPVLVPGDGLYLDNIQYTDLGVKNAKNYCDLSPAPILNENNEVIGLHSVALTPTGAIDGLTFYSAGLKMKELKTLVIDDEEALKETQKLAEHIRQDMKGNPQDDKEALKLTEKLEEHEKAEMGKYNAEESDNEAEDSEEDMDEDEKELQGHLCATCLTQYSMYKTKQFAKANKSLPGAVVVGDEKTKQKTLSADIPMPNAYKNTEPATSTQTRKIMFETLKAIAPEKLGMKTEAEVLEILKELVAKWAGVEDGKLDGPITNEENSGIKEFSARLAALETKYQATISAQEAIDRQEIVEQASKDGKVLPLSADSIKSMPVATLREMVEKLPANKVPMKSNARAFNTDGKTELKGLAKASAAIQAQIS